MIIQVCWFQSQCMKAKSNSRLKGNVKVQLKPFSTQGVVVDSNLFILYLVGIFKTIEIDLFEKSKQFGEKTSGIQRNP